MAKSKGRRLAEWLRNLDSNSKASTDTIADTSITFAKLHTALVVTETNAIGSNDNDTTIATSAAIKDYVDTQVAGKDNTDEITEGSTNLYFTDTRSRSALSVTTATAGTAALAYNSTTGAFTYTPPDLSSYLTSFDITTQTDPKYLRSDTDDSVAGQLTFPSAVGNRPILAGGFLGMQSSDADVDIWGISEDYYPSHATAGNAWGIRWASTPNQVQFVGNGTNRLVVDLDGGSTALTWEGNAVWHAGNDGPSSGLDADTVDGIQGSNLLTLSGTQTITGVKTFSVASGNVFKLNDTNATNATTANIYFYFQANGSNLGYIGYGSGTTNYLYISNPSAPIYLAGSSCLVRGGYEVWGTDNDGSGSGLDADTLDGVDSALYFKSYTNNNGGWSQSNRNFSVRTGGNAVGLHMEESDGTFGFQLYGNGSSYGFLGSEWGAWDIKKTPSGNMALNNSDSNIVWHAGNDGSGSGLDADTLDGQQGSYYTSMANATGQFTTISATSASSRDKIRVYPNSNYAIGMQDNITYGHLGDWAMTFQMNNDAQSDRGFWWGDAAHGLSQGAMSLTVNGRATIATSLSIGQGESITGPGTAALYVSGGVEVVGGNTQIFYTTTGSARGFLQATDTNDQHFIVATSGGEDIAFKDGGTTGDTNFVMRGDGQCMSRGGLMNLQSVSTNKSFGYGFSTSVDPAGGYGLFRQAGAWSNPYPDIILQGHTGIQLNANPSYDGVRCFADYNSSTRIIQINGTSNYIYKDVWMHTDGGEGMYSSTNGSHIYPNTTSTYGSWAVSGSKGSYGGIYDSYGGHNMMWDSGGNGGDYRQTNGRWIYYHHISNNCTGFSGSATSSAYSIYVNGAIYATSNITAYSDRRVKENIIQIDSALDKVNKLEGVYYNKIDDETKTKEIGFIAQDVQEVVPELVTYAEDVDEYGVKYGNATALLVEAVKELTQKVKELEKKLEEK